VVDHHSASHSRNSTRPSAGSVQVPRSLLFSTSVRKRWAVRLAADAEQTARSVTDPIRRAMAFSQLVKALAGVDPDRAVRLAADAEQAAHSVTSTYHQAEALRELATALVEARLWDRAE
jgi:hypothetical protein